MLNIADLVSAIEDRFGLKIAETLSEVSALRAIRVRSEDARKRLRGYTLKTTYNGSRIQALEVFISRETEQLRPAFKAVVGSLVEIEMARQDLRNLRAAERQLKRERSGRDMRQLHVDTYDFIDALYNDHDVDGSVLSTLTAEDRAQIATIALARHQSMTDKTRDMGA